MKAYTDINQSKKLAEILPIESADMKWFIPADNEGEFIEDVSLIKNKSEYNLFDKVTDWDDTPYVPCWSLAALVSVLPRIDIEKEIWYSENYDYRVKAYIGDGYVGDWYDNPIDACYKMILELIESNLLKLR